MFNSAEAVVGAKFALWNRNGVNRVEVLRLTPTMIVTTTGGRYNRTDGTQVGGSEWERSHLGSLEDQDAKDQFNKQALNNLSRKLMDASEAFRANPTQENLDIVKSLTTRVEARL